MRSESPSERENEWKFLGKSGPREDVIEKKKNKTNKQTNKKNTLRKICLGNLKRTKDNINSKRKDER